MYPVLYPIAGDTVPIEFDTFDGGTGASITMTGLAVTDVEVYKDGGTTQRASDNGYALLDTDGIDFDGITGIHGFSIDLSDNSDAGFYEVGPWYTVVVSSITVDGQTVSFIAAKFRIVSATRGLAGTALPDAAADAVGGIPISDAGGLDMDAKLANTNEVTAARMGALTDLIDGGRLDLLIDAIKAKTDSLTFTVAGKVDSNALLFAGQTITCAAGVTILASVGTAATSTAQTGDTYAVVTNATYGNSAIRTRGDSAWVTATSVTVSDKTGFKLASDGLALVTAWTTTITGNIVGTVSTVTTLTGHTAQTGDSFARIGAAGAGLTAVPWNAAWDSEVQSECADAITAAGLSSAGTGEFAINHNSGGANALAALTAGAAGIAGITVRAYLTSDYTAGNQASDYVRGTATTNDAGGWISSMMLNAGTYTVRYDDPTGTYQTTTKSLTIAADGTASVT